MAIAYLVLDLCSVVMMKDAYWILGPENTHPLPPYLASLPLPVLELVRSLTVMAGTVAALALYCNLDQLWRWAIGPRVLGICADLWQHPTVFGNFVPAVLDRGMAGFWGTSWHQTFRAGFVAPTEWLVRRGYLRRGATSTKLVAGFLAFAQSGFLHAAGSYTSLRETKPWGPALFFMAMFVGIVVQEVACRCLQTVLIGHGDFRPLQKVPRAWKRMGNLAFVMLWLHLFRWALVDDMARCGLWLFEPVPFSLLRALGFGKPGDTVYRAGEQLPGWHTGRFWWESGILI
jgi:hypothetical protein